MPAHVAGRDRAFRRPLPPRLNPWRRARRIAAIALVMGSVPIALSYLTTLLGPSNSSFTIRSFEWLRYHGAAQISSQIERKIVIGDPIDKPDPRFFDKVFQAVAQYGSFPMEKILVIGDSERSDLQEPKRRGCATFLVKR